MRNESSADSSHPSSSPSHAEVAQLAHELWLQQGCPTGRDQEHWHEAERLLREGPQINRREARATAAGDLLSTKAAPVNAPDPLRANDPLDPHGVQDRQVPKIEKELRPKTVAPRRPTSTVL